MTKSCVKTLNTFGANEVLQNVTFLGGAADCIDKSKHKTLWKRILHQTIPGTVKNVHTDNDWILLLYTVTQFDRAMGRNAVFKRQIPGQRVNLAHENPQDEDFSRLDVIVEPHFKPFNLSNHDIWSFGVGHTDYRNKLDVILWFIEFK